MRSQFTSPFGSALLLGLIAPALTSACGGDSEEPGASAVPGYSGVPGTQNAMNNTNPLQPGQTNDQTQGANTDGQSGNSATNNNGTAGNQNNGQQSNEANEQNINGNVDTSGQSNTGGGNNGMNNQGNTGTNDGSSDTMPTDEGDDTDPVNPPATAARVGAELCPAGPFGDPLAGNPQPEIFTRQVDGVFDFFNWEGVVWVDGALYWSEIGNNNEARINRKVPGQDMQRGFIADSGSNGLAVDLDGNLVAASHLPMGQISTFQLPGGARTVGNQQFEGQFFNSPNDLVLRNDGNIYFTDPAYQAGGNQPQSNNRVYRISPTGDLTEVDGSYQSPNGITLSPDGNTLYVSGDGPLRAYPLDAAGVPGAPSTFPMQLQVPDGMTVDCAGNIYAVEYNARRIQIFSPDGNQIGTITSNLFDQPLTNVAFGGDDMQTLFISGAVIGANQGAIYSMQMNVPGMPY